MINHRDIETTLTDRGKRYGRFKDHAGISQALKAIMRQTAVWELLEVDQREALEMVAHKVARILNGDPDYADSWHDIAGYVRLVEVRLGEGGQ